MGSPERVKTGGRRRELTKAEANQRITDKRWRKLLAFLSSGYTLADSLDEAEVLRANYQALIIVDSEKREQVDKAREQWLRYSWPEDAVSDICIAVSGGTFLKDAVVEFGPVHLDDPISSFYRLLQADPIYGERYRESRRMAMENMADEILSIADEDNDDLIQSGKGGLISNPSAVRRAEVRIKTREWLMEKYHARQFGNRVDINSKIEVKDHASLLSEARLRKKEVAGRVIEGEAKRID